MKICVCPYSCADNAVWKAWVVMQASQGAAFLGVSQTAARVTEHKGRAGSEALAGLDHLA